jgi:tetratricopeptide (TPR) repeat protein
VGAPLDSKTLGGRGDRDDILHRAMSALNGQHPQEALQCAEEVLKTDPRHGQALRIFGCALVMLDRAADAIAPLEKAARQLRTAEADTVLAIALRKIGRNEDAVSKLKRAIKRRPPYAAAFHELGYLLFSLQRDNEAIEMLRQGVQIAPMMPEMSIQLGYVFLRQRNCAEAKGAFARALEISPNSADALSGMAGAHQQIGENEQAADYLRRYLRQRPHNVSAWISLGHCLLELGQLEAGYDCFRTAAQAGPTSYGRALSSLASAARGRLWLRPSHADLFLRRGTRN